MGSFMSLPKESAPPANQGLGASGHPRNLTQLTAKKAELKAALLREAITSRKRRALVLSGRRFVRYFLCK